MVMASPGILQPPGAVEKKSYVVHGRVQLQAMTRSPASSLSDRHFSPGAAGLHPTVALGGVALQRGGSFLDKSGVVPQQPPRILTPMA
jgi:hypothetical protein